MADFGAHALASLYLGQFTPSFWQWSDRGNTLVWTDGTTIALRGELEEILVRLAQSGFPSLSAIALVLAACRDDWGSSASAVSDALLPRVDETSRAAFEAQLDLAWAAMERIAALPAGLRRGVEAKTVLLEVILEGAERRHSPSEAELIVAALGDGVTPAKPGGLVEWAPPSLTELAEDLDAIDAGTRGLDPAALRLRLRTGLDDPVLPAEVELPDSERVRRLLAELREDRELAGLARLARDLLATVQVPRSVSAPNDQPMGGVSDISNRGPLHRLLISELAHDPLTFTVRIATGEALYLRREAPPLQPPSRRIVLLDTGIRMWGVSRVYATAVGLALVASAGACDAAVYRSQDGDLLPCDLTCRAGLATHLEALEPTPQPGRALAQLFEQTGSDADADVVLVTHRDALADPSFRATLAEIPPRQFYIASVDAEGGYQLESRSSRGRKVLGRATLDLGLLLDASAPRSRPGTRLREEGAPDLPSILSVDPFPFLLSARLDARRIASHPLHGLLAVTRDGRLLHWASQRWDVGGRQLTTQVPKGTLHWLEIDDEGLARVLIHQVQAQRLVLLTVDIDSGHVRRANVGQVPRSLLCATRVGGVFALIHPWHVDVVSLAHATLGESMRLPDPMSWVRGRFFCTLTPEGREWHALAWDGAQLLLERVPTGEREDALVLWDRRGVDGPWALSRDGAVHSLASNDPPPPPLGPREGRVSFHGLSRDGHRLVIQEGGGARYLLDLELEASRRIYAANYLRSLQREPGIIMARAPQLRRRFDSIGIDEQGNLALVSRRNRIVPIWLNAQGRLVLGPGQGSTGRVSFLKAFVPVVSPPGVGYGLQAATWPGGSQAFLDSRGLLHLVPSVGDELTFVLCDQSPLAVWSNGGHLTGPAYYLGHERIGTKASLELLQLFIASVG